MPRAIQIEPEEKPTKVSKVDAVLCADLHLRDDVPECRTDDFQAAQWRKVRFISMLCEKHNCPLVVAGDVFHHWKPSPGLLAKTIAEFPEDVLFIPGQHDLPQHSMELYDKSGCAVLERTPWWRQLRSTGIKVDVLNFAGFPFGGADNFSKLIVGDADMLVLHLMVWYRVVPFPDCTADSATALLRKIKGPKLILTGDNHQPFVVRENGRLLVNPGSMMRTTVAQIDYRPRVYLWDAEGNEVEAVYLPIEEGVVSRERADAEVAREGRVEAFVKRLQEDVESGLDYKKAVERELGASKAGKSLRELVWKLMEE